jgi:uncharacterized damage-inducible protein DinB
MIWLDRLHGAPPTGMAKPEAYPDMAAVRAQWAGTESQLATYVRGLTAADLDRILEFSNAKGVVFRDQIANILQHLANHGSYHRGQITTLLRQLGAKPVSTDMIGFYRERAAAKAAS